MTSAAMIEDRLREAEEKAMEKPPEEDGCYLVIRNKQIERIEDRTPPTPDELRRIIGLSLLENAPMRAMPGVYYWVWAYHSANPRTAQILYEDHGELFIQEDLSGVVVITRIDKWGRIRLLSKADADTCVGWIRVK